MTRRVFTTVALNFVLAAAAFAQFGGELRFCLRADPKTFDPLQVDDDNSEAVRYLTSGVLLRVNRVTQEFTPELATSWKIDQQGRRITFQLRHDVTFSDGTPFSSADVAYTMTKLMDPALHSPTADPFRSSSEAPQIATPAADVVAITFGAPVSGVERLFDQVPILSAHSPKAVLGPFTVASYKPGVEVLLSRNPRYWKEDSTGRRLPYLDRIHLQIQENRDIELVKFRRGEIDLINSLDAEVFDQLAHQSPTSVTDAGPSLESEMMWFNQAAKSPLPAYKKAWFASQQFRRAVSEALHREDIARVVYKGHARPALGPISPANKFWVNASLRPHPYDVASALHRLQQEGFTRRNGVLYDREGHAVEFSLATNAGNRSREQMAAMIQQDLQAIGIHLTVVTLDFPSLIERMTKTYQYEACLLGLTNVDLDPSAQMNVWLSSASNHQWNPSEAAPATPWEAEIDKLMHGQAAETSLAKRKQLFDRVQQIVWDEEPFLYLVDKNSLMAFSPALHNMAPAAIQPRAYWNIDMIQKSTQSAGVR
ncbi:MAG TPA: ABC transporter substrate-binding protein [Bryobacteraceae bacterium]|jgi:peptide/nickel transport system substrate-binding protein|nr:ABC transporter substrate-binding protein [Bryobacteraceae bacterium]